MVLGLPLGSIIANTAILPSPGILRLPMLLTAIPMFISAFISLSLSEPKVRRRPRRSESIFFGIRFFLGHRVLRVLVFDLVSISVTTYFIFWFYQSALQSLNIGIFYFGFVGAAFYLLPIVALAYVKRIEKVVGKRRLLFLTALIPGIFYAMMGLSFNLPVVIVAIFAIVGANIFRDPLFDSYINAHVPSDRRATVLATLSTFERLAMMVAYPIVGLLSDWSLQYTFLLLGMATIALALSSRVTNEML
ncbi:Major Facilitator Superfamily protein [uncultured archaeon]|nr:Major Facilitator Superfamily protein [uncultured archaeon]